MKIRATSLEQIPQVVAMEQKALSWICPFTADQHALLIQAPHAFHALAIDESGLPLGFLILEGLDTPHRAVMLRRVVAAWPRRGIGKFLVKWAMHYCFIVQNKHRLWLEVFTDNTPAIALYESVGMVREGTSRESIWQHGRWRSLYHYSILEDEYFKRYPS